MARGNVLIIGPNQLFREALKQLLQKARFVVCGEGGDLTKALGEAEPGKPADMVILMLEAGGSLDTGLAQIGGFRRDLPGVKLVALAASLSNAELLRAMRAGVDAILTRDISSGVLQTSLELVMQNQQMFLAPMDHLLSEAEPRPGLAGPVPDERRDERKDEESSADEVSNLVPFTLVRSAPIAATVPTSPARAEPELRAILPERPNSVALSERERQILRCLTKGFSNKVIARELAIAETTVKVHVKGLMRKVRADNRTQAAIWAMNHYFTFEEMVAHGIKSGIAAATTDQPCSA